MNADQRRARFWGKMERRANSNCWEWQGFKDRWGYGRTKMEGQQLAHRAAYVIAHGAIPDGMCVLHRCDNPPCCNPDHLFLGTVADNNADMVAKGRHFVPSPCGYSPLLCGERNSQAKLTDFQVSEIRRRRAQGERTVALAEEFSISQRYVYKLVHGEWRV
jgi:hypothetical protein